MCTPTCPLLLVLICTGAGRARSVRTTAGIPRNSMEFHGIPGIFLCCFTCRISESWDSMRFHGIPWNSMEFQSSIRDAGRAGIPLEMYRNVLKLAPGTGANLAHFLADPCRHPGRHGRTLEKHRKASKKHRTCLLVVPCRAGPAPPWESRDLARKHQNKHQKASKKHRKSIKLHTLLC